VNVGRLVEQKGQRSLLQAAAVVAEARPEVRFALAGDGPLREQLEEDIRRLELADNVVLLGAIDDVPSLLASADVFALPSLYEGLCYAVIEAQAAGVPVVATPVGGVPENVVPGETGLLVPPGDSGALAQALVWMLEHPAEAGALADEARRRAFARYSKRRMVEQTAALYRRPSSRS
jgi:glycosyltransferase involved in cell wall biosynthesis